MACASNSPSADIEGENAPNIPCVSCSVGVVIVNFFCADYLRRSLLALMHQTRRADAILIINNGDQVGALDFVASDYPSVRVVDQSNIGFAAANNLAIDLLGDRDWIALLNPDAYPDPAWLEELLAAANIHPEITFFSSLLLQADNVRLMDGDGDSYHVSGLAWRHNHGAIAQGVTRSREIFSACAAAALYRRDAILDIGGFDPAYFCYFEDVDLGFRLRLRGYRCLQVPSAVVQHVGSGSSGGRKQSDFALYHGHRNLVWTYVKNMPGYWFWLFLPVHISLNLLELVWFTCKGRGRVIGRAKIDALKALPVVWRQRKIIQATRLAKSFEILKRMSFWPLTRDR